MEICSRTGKSFKLFLFLDFSKKAAGMAMISSSFLPVPVAILAVGVAYKFLKFNKQDANVVRQMLYRKSQPVVIGHRGGQFEGPENTLALVEVAANNGATAVEVDLDFSQDEVPIIIHDDTVDRTTDGKGKVCDYQYSHLLKLNAAAKHNTLRSKDSVTKVDYQKIPTLTEMVETCIKNDLLIVLDVKTNAKLTVKALKDLQTKFENVANHILVTSFSPSIIYMVRKECPEFLAGLIWRHYYFSHSIAGEPYYTWYVNPFAVLFDQTYKLLFHYFFPDFFGIALVSLHKDHLSKWYIRQFRRQGVEVLAWTVNNPIEKEFLLKVLQIPIMTDSILNYEECPEQTN